MKKYFYISLALFINILFFFTSCSPSVSGWEYPHILSECEIQDMGITQKDETNSKENTMVFETKQGHAAYYYAYPVYDQGNNQATFTPQNTASEWLRLFPGHSQRPRIIFIIAPWQCLFISRRRDIFAALPLPDKPLPILRAAFYPRARWLPLWGRPPATEQTVPGL